MKTDVLRADNPVALEHARDVLLNGGLVAFPTDTVYGLASLAFETNMVESLYVAKGRNSSRAIAILLGDLSQLEQVTQDINQLALRLAERFWPGPITLVVPKHPKLPPILSTNPNIGVRMPDHPVALTLLRMMGPLAVTSANLSGQANTATAQEVLEQLAGRIHLIIDGGAAPGGIPSTVVDCTGSLPVVVRQGPITLNAIQSVISD